MSSATNVRPPVPLGGHGRSTPGWLSRFRIVRAGGSLSLLVAGRVFEQFGASVVPLDAAGGSEAWTDADIVLVDRIGGPQDLPGLRAGRAAEYLDFVQRTNRSVWVTTSAFGLTNSRADAVGSDVTVLASAGILGHSRIGSDWAPTIPAGSIGLKVVGDVIALAALHALQSRLSGGSPVHVDLSAQAAVVATGLTLEMAHALLDCPDEGGSARYGAPTGFFQCLDGAVYVVVLEQHQWRGFQASLAPALDEIGTVEEGRLRHDEVNQAMADWAATRRAEDCERILQAAGVACTAVNSVDDLVRRSQAAGRPLVLGAGGAPMPAVVTEAPAVESSPPADRLPLEALRVLDAGHVLAVPLATAWLGAMGADVVKLEDPDRLDVYRRRGPFSQGIPGLNRSAYFNAINFCKRGVDVAITPAGSTLDLGDFDVVVQNLSPRRAAQVGVDAPSVLAADHPTMLVSSSGFGSTGAWSTYRAYGHNIHAFAGLVAATRNARGEMADVGTPWCDPLTSVAIATWVCAWSLAPARDRSVVADMSMAELMASQLQDLVGVDAEETYRPQPDDLEFFFRAGRSDRVVAVSLHGESDRKRFEALIGSTVTRPTRRGGLVDLTPGPWADLDDADLEDWLLSAGLAASVVRTAPELAQDPFLRRTGLFGSVESSDLGRYDVTGLPWRFVGWERATLRAAPERPAAR